MEGNSKETLTLNDFKMICRFCLKKNIYMKSIFENSQIPSKIQRSFQLLVAENDMLPSNICFRCMNRIEIYTEYRDKCIENDKLLRSIAFKNKERDNKNEKQFIKTEQTDDSLLIEMNFNPTEDAKTRREKYLEAVKGETEFYPDENSLLMVVDPTKYYSSEQSDDGTQTDNETEPPPSRRRFPNSQQENNEILRDVFLCKHCDLAFTKYELCLIHELSDHDTAFPHTCNFCTFNCINRNTVIIHIKDVHATDKPYICVQCKKGFGRRSDLKKHTIVHTGVRPFKCHVCSKNFSRNTNLTKHMRIHSGHKPHVCSKCPRSFITKSDLFRHYQIHLEAKPFNCNMCNSSFTRKDKLTLHQKKHLKLEEVFVPEKTNEIVNNSTEEHQVEQEEQDTVNMVISLDPFQDMDQTSHDIQNEQQMNQSGFSVPDHIQNLDLTFHQHVTGDNIITYQDLENTKSIDDKSRNYPCDQCTKRFTTNTSLQNHKNIHLGIRDHICQICKKAFLRKRELDRHNVTHSNVKPFECLICHKKFGRKDKLLRHEKIHTEEKNYSCQECDAKFIRKEGLLLHSKVHKINYENNINKQNLDIKLDNEFKLNNSSSSSHS